MNDNQRRAIDWYQKLHRPEADRTKARLLMHIDSGTATVSDDQFWLYHRHQYLLAGRPKQILKELPSRPTFPEVWLCSGPHWGEFRAELATALLCAKESVLVCVAKEHGSSRLAKWPELEELVKWSDSKQHCRVVLLTPPDGDARDYWLSVQNEGQLQLCNETRFISQPGLYGWDKIDVGSQLLAQNLPDSFPGEVADFGCGYGFLSRVISDKLSGQALHCVDNDRRALTACQQNISQQTKAHFHWLDLEQERLPCQVQVVVTNPPFHQEAKSKPELGIQFLEKAAQALVNDGELWMVANTSLNYEDCLEALFETHREVMRKNGFKVLWAQTPIRIQAAPKARKAEEPIVAEPERRLSRREREQQVQWRKKSIGK